MRKYCLITYWQLNLLSCRTGFTHFLLTLHSVVEFKMEESMKKAAEVLNKHSLSGRPLKVKEDPDGEHARRAVQKAGRLGSTVFVANLDYKVGW